MCEKVSQQNLQTNKSSNFTRASPSEVASIKPGVFNHTEASSAAPSSCSDAPEREGCASVYINKKLHMKQSAAARHQLPSAAHLLSWIHSAVKCSRWVSTDDKAAPSKRGVRPHACIWMQFNSWVTAGKVGKQKKNAVKEMQILCLIIGLRILSADQGIKKFRLILTNIEKSFFVFFKS